MILSAKYGFILLIVKFLRYQLSVLQNVYGTTASTSIRPTLHLHLYTTEQKDWHVLMILDHKNLLYLVIKYRVVYNFQYVEIDLVTYNMWKKYGGTRSELVMTLDYVSYE